MIGIACGWSLGEGASFQFGRVSNLSSKNYYQTEVQNLLMKHVGFHVPSLANNQPVSEIQYPTLKGVS